MDYPLDRYAMIRKQVYQTHVCHQTQDSGRVLTYSQLLSFGCPAYRLICPLDSPC